MMDFLECVNGPRRGQKKIIGPKQKPYPLIQYLSFIPERFIQRSKTGANERNSRDRRSKQSNGPLKATMNSCSGVHCA